MRKDVQSKNAKELREELVSQDHHHFNNNFTFLDSKNYFVPVKNESCWDINELIIKSDDTGGNEQIRIKCAA